MAIYYVACDCQIGNDVEADVWSCVGDVRLFSSACRFPLDFIFEHRRSLLLTICTVHPGWLRTITALNLKAIAVTAFRTTLVASLPAKFTRPTASILGRLSWWHGDAGSNAENG